MHKRRLIHEVTKSRTLSLLLDICWGGIAVHVSFLHLFEDNIILAFEHNHQNHPASILSTAQRLIEHQFVFVK